MLKTSPVTTALINVRELIADEKNHCRKRLTNQGPNGENQYCVAGAMMAVIGEAEVVNLPLHPAWRLLEKAARHLFCTRGGPEWWGKSRYYPVSYAVSINNCRPHADTVDMIDRAIAMSMETEGA